MSDNDSSIDWFSIFKWTSVLAGAAVGGWAVWECGKAFGHTEGEEDGFVKASNKYESKFKNQEVVFRKTIKDHQEAVDKTIRRMCINPYAKENIDKIVSLRLGQAKLLIEHMKDGALPRKVKNQLINIDKQLRELGKKRYYKNSHGGKYICKICGSGFSVTAGELAFLQEKSFVEPKTCNKCREKRKVQRTTINQA